MGVIDSAGGRGGWGWRLGERRVDKEGLGKGMGGGGVERDWGARGEDLK